MARYKCRACERHEKDGHNFCRICGFHLTKGYVQYPRNPVVCSPDEKYCGYCGEERDQCNC
jgi:hypothetical protein